MSGLAARGTVDAGLERLGLALALSTALHAILAAVLEAAPPVSRVAAGAPLQAFLAVDAVPPTEGTIDSLPAEMDRDRGYAEAILPTASPIPDSARMQEQSAPAGPIRVREWDPPADYVERVRAPAPQAARAESMASPDASARSELVRPASSPLAEVGDAGLSVPDDSTYYTIAALDRPPMPLSPPDACYPQGATGEVVYELLIDERGTVRQAEVLFVEPKGLFTAAAAQLCARVPFSPALKDGRSVRSRVRFVVGRG